MKKNGDANNNPILMLVLGILFAGAGIAVLIFVKEKELAVTLVAWRLAVAGVLILVWTIYRAIVISKYNSLMKDTTAYLTEATFAGTKFAGGNMTSVNGIPVKANLYKKIQYTYKDETGAVHTATSINSYTPNQVSFLEQKGTFKIKCRGRISAIIEEVPEMNASYNL